MTYIIFVNIPYHDLNYILKYQFKINVNLEKKIKRINIEEY